MRKELKSLCTDENWKTYDMLRFAFRVMDLEQTLAERYGDKLSLSDEEIEDIAWDAIHGDFMVSEECENEAIIIEDWLYAHGYTEVA